MLDNNCDSFIFSFRVLQSEQFSEKFRTIPLYVKDFVLSVQQSSIGPYFVKSLEWRVEKRSGAKMLWKINISHQQRQSFRWDGYRTDQTDLASVFASLSVFQENLQIEECFFVLFRDKAVAVALGNRGRYLQLVLVMHERGTSLPFTNMSGFELVQALLFFYVVGAVSALEKHKSRIIGQLYSNGNNSVYSCSWWQKCAVYWLKKGACQGCRMPFPRTCGTMRGNLAFRCCGSVHKAFLRSDTRPRAETWDLH